MHVLDVATYILRRAGPMSAMKLQKLVYYGQAWSLALRGSPLFEQKIQAWAYGPVVYELFDRHRGHFVVSSLGAGVPSAVCGQARELLEGVIEHYGQLDGVKLSEMTHSEDPWKHARGETPEQWSSASEITQESMRRYYSGKCAPWARV